ncbi:MAG: class I SAM-dependent methyltransferase [Thermodesulfobacteriota bacterium]
MAIAHISILLLSVGKGTPGDRVHSRLRYLALTGLNLLEVVIASAMLQFLLMPLSTSASHYAPAFTSHWHMIYYDFVVAVGVGAEGIRPISGIAYFHSAFTLCLGLEILVVVLAILFTISPEDEVINKSTELGEVDYWAWRAQSFSDSQWATSEALQVPFLQALADEDNVKDVLDLGCGVGLFSLALGESGYQVYGIDASQQMVGAAQKTAKTPSINFREGSAQSIPFPDEAFDAVVARMVLHNVLPRWEVALTETRRVLRTGGMLLVLEGVPPNDACRQFFRRVLLRVHQRHFFSEKILIEGIRNSRFEIQRQDRVVLPRMNIARWLSEAVPDPVLRTALLNEHERLPEKDRACADAYNLNLEGEEVLVDAHFLFVVARAT